MFRRQLGICILALITTLICSSSAYSQNSALFHASDSNLTTIGIGPNASVVLFASADLPNVDSLDISIPLLSPYEGGTLNISNPPPVVNISGLGIFSEATTVFSPIGQSNLNGGTAVLSLPDSTALTGTSPVAEIFFDTSGLSGGDTFAYGVESAFFDGNQRFESANVLTFFATAEAVPEPSSAGFLAVLGSIAMMRRRRS